MKLYYFSEMPHHEYPDEEGDKYPSLRLEFPNRFFDRETPRACGSDRTDLTRLRRPFSSDRSADSRNRRA